MGSNNPISTQMFEKLVALSTDCPETVFLKSEIFPTLLPLLTEMLQLVVEFNTQFQPPDAPCIGTLPKHLETCDFDALEWLATQLKANAQEKAAQRAAEVRPLPIVPNCGHYVLCGFSLSLQRAANEAQSGSTKRTRRVVVVTPPTDHVPEATF